VYQRSKNKTLGQNKNQRRREEIELTGWSDSVNSTNQCVVVMSQIQLCFVYVQVISEIFKGR